MSIDDLAHFRVKAVSPDSHLSWTEGFEFSIPADVMIRSGLIHYLDSEGNATIPSDSLKFAENDAESLRLMAAFTDRKPLSTRLPFSYQKIPPRIRSRLGSLIGKWKRRQIEQGPSFPRWPLDLSADFLADLSMNENTSPFSHSKTPVLLTHDIDSAEGLTNLCKWFLGMEEAVGARSTSFIVPNAWPVDHNQLRYLKMRGHEIGIHGYDHSNITAFSSPDLRYSRIKAAKKLIEQYAARGYRSPSLLRTRGLLKDLSRHYLYDSSIPTSGGLFPVPNNGCASARPFLVENIHEIPLSLPRDGSLIFLGYSPSGILDAWMRCAQRISQSSGVVVLLTHCENRFSGNSTMRETYQRFLEFISSSDQFFWSSFQEVLSFSIDPKPP